MRLTSDRARGGVDVAADRRPAKVWTLAIVIGALLLVFELDRATAAAPVQHLYYLPIVIAGVYLGRAAGLGAALAAVVLYHIANPVLLTLQYKEPDLVQIALFVAVGAVTARLATDARRLHRLATTDDLTGLHNLRSFEARLTPAVRASRQQGRPLSLLVLDVDRLKSLNDTHGHLAGAEAVRAVGRVLAEHLPPGAIACRYGGDEFVVALPGHAPDQANAVADDLRRAVHALAPMLAGISFPAATLSISIGLASMGAGDTGSPAAWLPDDTAAGEALFRAADQALYVSKGAGRNRVSLA